MGWGTEEEKEEEEEEEEEGRGKREEEDRSHLGTAKCPILARLLDLQTTVRGKKQAAGRG